MSDFHLPIPRASNARGILILLAAIPPLALALYAVAGAVVAAAVCGIYLAALGLTLRAERGGNVPSRDPATGLPDRAAALARLEEIFEQRLAGSSQAAVFVISLADPPDRAVAPADRPPLAIMAVARLAQGLRRGDQIVRIDERTLAAILGPSRGMTARAAENILARIDGMFAEPLRVGPRLVPMRVSLGACLQHDAPRADAESWLQAAELAAVVAAEEGEPRLFPSGATRADRSAWDDAEPPALPSAAEEAAWHEAGSRRADDPAAASYRRRSRRA